MISQSPYTLIDFIELFIKNFFFWWSPHYSAFETPNNNPPKKYMQFQQNSHSLITWNKSRRHMNPVLATNTSRQYESKARFLEHYKWDLSLLAPALNCKIIKFSLKSAYDYNSNTHKHTRTPQFQDIFPIFKQLAEDLTRIFPSRGHSRKSLTHLASLFPWETLEPKRWNPEPTLSLLSLNKPRKTAGPNYYVLLYTTTAHPPTIKVLQTTKITKEVLWSANHCYTFNMDIMKYFLLGL